MADAAWESTAWLCAMLEVVHASKGITFDPDKWHPMRKTNANLTPAERRGAMNKQSAEMPKTFEEFQANAGRK